MDALQIVALIAAALKVAAEVGPIVIKTAENAKPFIMQLVSGLLGKELTPDQQIQIEAQLDALSILLQTPLLPADEEDV